MKNKYYKIVNLVNLYSWIQYDGKTGVYALDEEHLDWFTDGYNDSREVIEKSVEHKVFDVSIKYLLLRGIPLYEE